MGKSYPNFINTTFKLTETRLSILSKKKHLFSDVSNVSEVEANDFNEAENDDGCEHDDLQLGGEVAVLEHQHQYGGRQPERVEYGVEKYDYLQWQAGQDKIFCWW